MADDAPKIIPFGKYKRRLVEELLIDDPIRLGVYWKALHSMLLAEARRCG